MKNLIVAALFLPIAAFADSADLPKEPQDKPVKVFNGPPPFDYFHQKEHEPVIQLVTGGGAVFIDDKFKLPKVTIQSTLGTN